jgi:hypothetical protein
MSRSPEDDLYDAWGQDRRVLPEEKAYLRELRERHRPVGSKPTPEDAAEADRIVREMGWGEASEEEDGEA